MASKFSMLQTMMPLPAVSRMTSSSYSFQPSTDSSTSTLPTGDCVEALAQQVAGTRRASWAMPLPAPPRVKLARRIMGKEISSMAWSAMSRRGDQQAARGLQADAMP